MDTLVPNQIGYLTKGLLAPWVVALVWLLLVMHSCMLLERGILGERLITLCTIVPKQRC